MNKFGFLALAVAMLTMLSGCATENKSQPAQMSPASGGEHKMPDGTVMDKENMKK